MTEHRVEDSAHWDRAAIASPSASQRPDTGERPSNRRWTNPTFGPGNPSLCAVQASYIVQSDAKIVQIRPTVLTDQPTPHPVDSVISQPSPARPEAHANEHEDAGPV